MVEPTPAAVTWNPLPGHDPLMSKEIHWSVPSGVASDEKPMAHEPVSQAFRVTLAVTVTQPPAKGQAGLMVMPATLSACAILPKQARVRVSNKPRSSFFTAATGAHQSRPASAARRAGRPGARGPEGRDRR